MLTITMHDDDYGDDYNDDYDDNNDDDDDGNDSNRMTLTTRMMTVDNDDARQ